jgi:nucleosome binding factor SPN SPT16 subunit
MEVTESYLMVHIILQDKGHADLAEKLPKNLGAAVGIELRDNTQALSPTNEKRVKAGMTFNVALGK